MVDVIDVGDFVLGGNAGGVGFGWAVVTCFGDICGDCDEDDDEKPLEEDEDWDTESGDSAEEYCEIKLLN